MRDVWLNKGVFFVGTCRFLNKTFYCSPAKVFVLRLSGCEAVADPGFPRGGGANPPREVPTYDFSKNCMKFKEFGPPPL